MRLWHRRETELPPAIPAPEPGQPVVEVIISPNGISHEYHVPEDGPVITTTPHLEIGHRGLDISHQYGYGPMDAATRTLYDSVKALSERIYQLSIRPRYLEVWGFDRRDSDYVRSDWTLEDDEAVIDCLARHMGWNVAPFIRTHQQTDDELFHKMDRIVARAAAEGTKPPKGWMPYIEP